MDIVTYALLKKYIKASLAGAGALQGDPGKSAYEIAVQNGFSGSEKEWINSLTGKSGDSPYIKDGYWFVGAVNTNVKATPSMNYNDLENRPTLNGKIIEGDLTSDDITINSIPLEDIEKLLKGED